MLDALWQQRGSSRDSAERYTVDFISALTARGVFIFSNLSI
jgi:hypothetical protein